MDFLLIFFSLQFYSCNVSVAAVRCLLVFVFVCVRVSVRVRQILWDAKTVKSVHWVCNIYYGWWWKAVPFILCMHKTINNNMEKPPVCHSRGEVERWNKVETMYSHSHTKTTTKLNRTAPNGKKWKRVREWEIEIAKKKNWRKNAEYERKWITFTYYMYIRTLCYPWPMTKFKSYRKSTRNDETTAATLHL